MEGIKRGLLWFAMLTKRLYRKPTFLVILLLIPVLVTVYSAAAKQDSGVMTIALAWDAEDSLSGDAAGKLRENSQLIRFVPCPSPEAAEDMVRYGKADAAWILEGPLEGKAAAFAQGLTQDQAFIRVVQRQENVTMALAREKLSGAVFDLCAQAFYLDFIRENVPELADLSDGELLEFYRNVQVGGELFQFEEPQAGGKTQESGYLTAPVRGLLAVVIVLCGMATAMYYIHDTACGTFAWLPEKQRPLAELGCQMVSVVNVSAVVLVSLTVSGLAGGIGAELGVLVLYAVNVSVFCMLLRRLFGSLALLGTMLPLLVVVMLAVCPVFFDLGALRQIQLLLPPTYFVNALYNGKYIGYMLAHTGVCGILYWLMGKLLKRA